MAELLEAVMVVSFGISWPMSILRSYKTRTAKGKSLLFLTFILIGYGAGITGKLLGGKLTYVFVFYVLNLIMVSADTVLYFRNKNLDAKEAWKG